MVWRFIFVQSWVRRFPKENHVRHFDPRIMWWLDLKFTRLAPVILFNKHMLSGAWRNPCSLFSVLYRSPLSEISCPYFLIVHHHSAAILSHAEECAPALRNSSLRSDSTKLVWSAFYIAHICSNPWCWWPADFSISPSNKGLPFIILHLSHYANSKVPFSKNFSKASLARPPLLSPRQPRRPRLKLESVRCLWKTLTSAWGKVASWIC